MTRSLNVTLKTTEQNLIVRSGKSEAAITNNKRLHWRYCTVEARPNQTDRKHRAASLRQQSYLLSCKRNASTVCVLSDIKIICCSSFYLSWDSYLGDGETDRREIFHDCRAVSRTMLLPYWWRYLQGSPNVGVKNGFGWTIFGLSDTGYGHLRQPPQRSPL